MPRAITSRCASRSRPTPSRPSLSSKPAASAAVESPQRAGGTGRLDDQLCFALYTAANAMQRTYTPLLKPFGLTYVGYLVLLVLWESDDQSVGTLGRRLFLDSGTLTPVLRRLEGLGYLDRRRSVTDERAVDVRLTPAGVALERQMDTVRAAIASKAALSDDAFAELRRDLRTLHARLIAP